jgi:hypothetical protein
MSIKKLIVCVAMASLSAFAQDAPYDDVDLKREEKGLPKETVEVQEALEQGQPARPVRRRTPPLFRFALKAGANYSVFQTTSAADTSTVTISGVGFDGLTSFGWDLPYQPIFLEFQSGYRQLFTAASSNSDVLTITALHVVPIGLGLAYRARTGPRIIFKSNRLLIRSADRPPRRLPWLQALVFGGLLKSKIFWLRLICQCCAFSLSTIF